MQFGASTDGAVDLEAYLQHRLTDPRAAPDTIPVQGDI